MTMSRWCRPGHDQRVAPGERVALPLAIVRDDGGAPSIEWSQTGPGDPPMPAVTLSSTTAQQPTFTAPEVTADTTLTFQLQVTEVGGAMRSVTDEVEVVVSNTPSAPTAPQAPGFLVTAGDDQTVAGGAAVTLDGSGSTGSGPRLGPPRPRIGAGSRSAAPPSPMPRPAWKLAAAATRW